MTQAITIIGNVQGGRIVAIKPLILKPEPIEVIKVNELLEPVYSSCSGKIKDIKVGDIRESTKSGKYRVIEDLGMVDCDKYRHRFFRIQFLETGFVNEVSYINLKPGLVKDLYQRSVCGVGFMGEIDFRLPYFKELYKTWNQLIDRCYNPKNKGFKDYGGNGVFVSSRWHSFTNFYLDAQELKGWCDKLCNWKNKRGFTYSLDKDILYASNHYSKEACLWASKNEQNLNTSVTKFFSAISPSGNQHYFVGCYYISEKYSLKPTNVSSCLSNKLSQTKGWTNFKPIIPPKGCVLRWWKN